MVADARAVTTPDVDDSSLQGDSLPNLVGLTVSGHLVLFYIHRMNQVNSRNEFVIIALTLS